MPLAREAFAVMGKNETGHGHGGAAERPPGTVLERAQRAALLAGDNAQGERGKHAGAGEGAKEGTGKGRDKGKAKQADPNQRSLVSFFGSSAAKAAEEKAREDPVPAKWCFFPSLARRLPLRTRLLRATSTSTSRNFTSVCPPSHYFSRARAGSLSLARLLALSRSFLSLATTGTRCGAKAPRAWK